MLAEFDEMPVRSLDRATASEVLQFLRPRLTEADFTRLTELVESCINRQNTELSEGV
jgi:hypothetical protein